MADFAGTVSKIGGGEAPFGNHHGALLFQIALSATTYAGGNLNLSSIAIPPGVQPSQLAFFNFTVSASAGYMISFVPNASPTFANLGALHLYTATGTEATGSLTLTVYGRAEIAKSAPITQ